MKNKRISLVCLGILSCFINLHAQVAVEMEAIRTRLRGDYLTPVGESVTAAQAFSLLNADGSFSDASSTEQVLTGRLVAMAKSYHESDFLGQSKTDFRYWMYKSLQYWLDHKPAWKWTGSAMVQPRYLGAILLVLYDDLAQDLLGAGNMKTLAEALRQDAIDFNHWCWLQGNTISENDITLDYDKNRGGNLGYRLWGVVALAAFSDQQSEMDWIHQHVKAQFPLQLNSANNYPVAATADGSRFQHNGGGAQNYIIGYGRDWWNYNVIVSNATYGTRWQLTEGEFDALASMYLDGYQWYYYKGQGAVNLAGRHGLVKDALKGSNGVASRIQDLRDAWSKHSAQPLKDDAKLQEAIDRLTGPNYGALDSSKYFWNSDLMVHGRSNYNVVNKMLSNRTTGPETGNGNGKLSYYLGDGATLILRTGNEYNNARVGWNYRAIPGITAEQKTDALPLNNWGANGRSNNSFAGGLSDGRIGLCAFDYNREHSYVTVRAQKGYFYFDEGFVALGADIDHRSGSGKDIWTTLNQTEWMTDITYFINGNQQTIAQGNDQQLSWSTSSLSWFHQDSIGYFILPKSGARFIKLFAQQRTGDWNDLDDRYSNGDNQSVDIFQLSIDHGGYPSNDTYDYVVVPNVSVSDMVAMAANMPFTTLYNNSSVQAVKSNSKEVYQAVCYAGNNWLTLKDGLQIRVNDPAMVQVDLTEEHKFKLRLADPYQNKSSFTVTVTQELSGDGVAYDEQTGYSTITVNLPSGLYVGQSVEKVLDIPIDLSGIYALYEDFETEESLGDWQSVSVDGIGGGGFSPTDPDIEWHYISNSPGKYARIYGNKQTNEDWLISPVMDFTSAVQKHLHFLSATRWGTDEAHTMGLWVSTDYNGGGSAQDVQSATWVDMTDQVNWAPTPGSSYDWFSSGNINLTRFEGNQVYLAFKFTADGSNGSTRNWHIDSVTVAWGDAMTIPSAQFDVNQAVILQGESVGFTDQSTGDPSTWDWTFNGSVEGSSSAQHPEVSYLNPGCFDVKLVVENQLGKDSLEQSCIVDVGTLTGFETYVPAEVEYRVQVGGQQVELRCTKALSDHTVVLYNVTGQCVARQNGVRENQSFDMKDINPGIYILSVQGKHAYQERFLFIKE